LVFVRGNVRHCRADPAIHPLRKTVAKMMDALVKPAHDGSEFPAHLTTDLRHNVKWQLTIF
jgi:hypothetical protein